MCVCVGWGGGGRTAELLVYIIHLSIPGKLCHKLSLKLECSVEYLFRGQLKVEKGKVMSMQAVRHVCGGERGKLHSFFSSVLAEVAASPVPIKRKTERAPNLSGHFEEN